MLTIDLAEAALADRDWTRVRELLRSLPDNAESDRSLEMLATAAWWLDDVATSITARERLFSLRRERGETSGCGDGGHPARLGPYDRSPRRGNRERLG